MAFVPDDAEDRFNELTPSAERFYIYLCKKRNHKTGISFGTLNECAEKYKWKRSTKFNARNELMANGWIEEKGNGWLLLVGDFSPMEKSKKLDSDENKSKKIDSKADEQSKNLDSESKKINQKSKKLDSHIRNIPALPDNQVEEELSETESPGEKKPGDTPELKAFRNRLWDFQSSYSRILDRKRIIANQKAIRQLYEISEGDAEICEKIHLFLRTDWDERKVPVMWTEVFRNFDFNKGRVNNGAIQKYNGTNYQDQRSKRAVDEHLAIERVRDRVEQRQRSLRGRDAVDS